MNSKCKILTFSSLEANIASENKSPLKMTFKTDVRIRLLVNLTFPFLNTMAKFDFSSNYEQFLCSTSGLQLVEFLLIKILNLHLFKFNSERAFSNKKKQFL